MAAYLTLALLISSSLSSSTALPAPNPAMVTAVQEMQRACYFTFATLINLANHRIPSNTTFLMPNDRMLSNISLTDDNIVEFLSAHSIPSPLLFEDLLLLPTGTVIPRNLPGLVLRVVNGGRKRYSVNGIMISGRNLCTAGSTFRCHGIDGVLETTVRNGTGASDCLRAMAPIVSPAPASLPVN